MSDSSLPYVFSTGKLKDLFEGIKAAQTPVTFNHDFLKTKLKIGDRAMLSFLKKINFLDSSGKPTSIYLDFRNPNRTKGAMAKAIKLGYSKLYELNEYAHDLDSKKLEGLICDVTGADHDSSLVRAVKNSFNALKGYADFDDVSSDNKKSDNQDEIPEVKNIVPSEINHSNVEVGFGLSYTINLNLPETTNIEVFNAIFKSLNENLLKK